MLNLTFEGQFVTFGAKQPKKALGLLGLQKFTLKINFVLIDFQGHLLDFAVENPA